MDTVGSASPGYAGAPAASLAAHLDRTYGLLRLALPTKALADAALRAAVSRLAREKAAELDTARDRLTSLALEQIGKRARREPTWCAGDGRRRLRSRRFALSVDERSLSPAKAAEPDAVPTDAEFAHRVLPDVTDFTLSTLIRSIEPRRRLVLVLSAIHGFDDATVAGVAGCQAAQVAELRSEAYDALRRLLVPEARRILRKAAMASKQAPPLLRAIPQMMPSGYVVIRDGKPFFQPMGSNPLLWWAKQLIHRFMERLQRRHYTDVEDDDVGKLGKKAKTPAPTPTLKPFKKPKPTPSMTGFKVFEPTRGTGQYGGQGSTPSTERLSSPRRPLSVGGSPHSSYTSARWR